MTEANVLTSEEVRLIAQEAWGRVGTCGTEEAEARYVIGDIGARETPLGCRQMLAWDKATQLGIPPGEFERMRKRATHFPPATRRSNVTWGAYGEALELAGVRRVEEAHAVVAIAAERYSVVHPHDIRAVYTERHPAKVRPTMVAPKGDAVAGAAVGETPVTVVVDDRFLEWWAAMGEIERLLGTPTPDDGIPTERLAAANERMGSIAAGLRPHLAFVQEQTDV